MKAEYDPKVTPWQIAEHGLPAKASPAEKLAYLLRYAILAPSSHNTQPWKFRISGDEIEIYIDKARWLQVADQDQRELHISAGCALENLLVAAEHSGYECQVALLPRASDPELAATVSISPRRRSIRLRDELLFKAMTARQTNRKVYDGRSLPPDHLQQLQLCSVEEGIQLFMSADPGTRRKVDELIVHADAVEFSDPAFREELGHWVGQGVFGTPWLMSKMGQLAMTHLNMGKGTARSDSEVLLSAPVLAVIVSDDDDRASQIRVGQVFERVFLRATALGISLQPMNQILQLPEEKAEVSKLVPAANVTPQITFRLGYAEPEKAHAPRRPLEEFIM